VHAFRWALMAGINEGVAKIQIFKSCALGEAHARGMDLTPLGEGCGVGSLGPATTGSGVFGTSELQQQS
jgi:hypothetical protein